MKLSLRLAATALLVSLIVLVGCQSATSSTPPAPPPDISTAPSAALAKYSTAFSALGSANPAGSGLPTGITVSAPPSNLAAINETLIFTNFTPDSGVTILNGTITVTGSLSGSPAVIHESGSLTFSGSGGTSGTVAFDITITITTSGQTSHTVIAGTTTIDGTAYSLNVSI